MMNLSNYRMLYFDIGANIGSWAIQNIPRASKIISVEASPYTFNELCTKVREHSTIVPLHFAISPSADSNILFYHCTKANTISTLDKEWLTSPDSRFYDYKDSIQEINVPTRTIDSLIKEYGIPDLLKIDVEGAENVVLQSLSQKVPHICFEWASEWKQKNIECIHHLMALGFTRFSLQDGDSYTFRPSEYPYSATELIEKISHTTPKKEWGMIWAI